ncbi:glycosyltransferase family 4 protein [Desulfonatronum thiodismutans]|uniref:glycosyltransferase family 4 protein n=1 Tax=Desulfonatronum thiodismutans TaxID=159290 RepID=UPI0004ABE768|nr:glycosyltransferase family 4 protein [Desulfonatronum thiodismutans]
MKILHLRSSNGIYGAEGVILTLVRMQSNLGIDSIVLGIRNAKNPHVEFIEKGVDEGLDGRSVDCKFALDLNAIHSIRNILQRESVDILHCHDYKANVFGLLASIGLKIKRVTTNHLWTGETFSLRLYEFFDGFFANFFNKVVAVSDAIAADAARFCISQQKVTTIYNGIDTDVYHPCTVPCSSLRNKFSFLPEYFILGMVGRLARQKGHVYLFQALQEIIPIHPNLRLVIAGDGPLRGELEQQITAAGLETTVIFCGIQTSMPEFYTMLDIFVLPSIDEGLPLVLLEAMSMQKPVIATDVGAVSRVIATDSNGLLVPSKDTKALVSAILQLMNNPKKSKMLAQNARLTVEERFSSRAMARNYEKLYHEVLGT